MKIIKSNSILPYVTNKDDILVSRIYRSMVDDSPFILILDRNIIVHNILSLADPGISKRGGAVPAR